MNHRPQRVMLTGSDGYIGSVMGPWLVRQGHEVVGIDSCWFESCDLFPDRLTYPRRRMDIRDITGDDLKNFDAVIHLAALCNDPLGQLNPALTLDINHKASVRLAALARSAGVKRFLYSSSCSMYGAAGDAVLDEEARLSPLTAYALSKVRAEEDIAKLATAEFSPVFMRNATAYGASPRLRADVVLNNLTCWAFATGKVKIMSDGSPWRPIVHIEDISRAFAAALDAPAVDIHNQALNIGVDGENYQVKDLAEIVRQEIPGCVVEYAGESKADPRNYRVDFSKVSRLLPEFRPKWNARLGVRELRAALESNPIAAECFLEGTFTRLTRLSHLLDSDRLDVSLRWRREDRDSERAGASEVSREG